MNFTAPFPIRDAAVQGDVLWLATDGGLRSLTPSFESRVYTSVDGLEETSQAAVVLGSDSLIYSVSELGILARQSKGGKSFQVINRSFLEFGDRIRDAQMVAAPDYLLLVFEKRLAFYQISTGLFRISLTKIADKELSSHPINALVLRGDSLMVAIDSGIYYRAVDLPHLQDDYDLADPSTWIKIDSLSKPILAMWYEKTGRKLDTLGGDVSVVNGNQIDRATPGAGSILRVAGRDYRDSTFCINGVCSAFWMERTSSGIVWLGNSGAIEKVSNSTKALAPTWSGIPKTQNTTLQTLLHGGIVAWGYPYLTWWSGTQFTSRLYNTTGVASDDSYDQAQGQPMKTLVYNSIGALMLGGWGSGVFVLARGADTVASATTGWLNPAVGNCMESFFPATSPSYAIPNGAVHLPNSNGDLFSYWGLKGGGIAYVGTDNIMQCLGSVLNSNYAGPMTGYVADNQWTIFAAYSESGSSQGSGGIDILHTSNPEYGDAFALQGRDTIELGELGTPRDLAWDPVNQRLWFVTASSLAYWNSTEDPDSAKSPVYMQGFQGGEFTSLEIDFHGHLWLGTKNQGAYEVSMLNGQPDSLIFSHYLTTNGMASNLVYDIAIVPSKGEVWFAHDLGLTRYNSPSAKDASLHQTTDAPRILAFPNPFHPDRQSQMLFENLAENAVLSIRDAAGIPVRTFRGNVGGRVVWDGTSAKGNRVAPGLYYWVAALGNRTEHGQIMILW